MHCTNFKVYICIFTFKTCATSVLKRAELFMSLLWIFLFFSSLVVANTSLHLYTRKVQSRDMSKNTVSLSKNTVVQTLASQLLSSFDQSMRVKDNSRASSYFSTLILF